MSSVPIAARIRETFFQNLMILGLEPPLIKKKHSLDVHKDMFCLPNKKGFEVVTYFLFSKLNKLGDVNFSIYWPFLSKADERDFRKACCTHLTTISQTSDVRFPRINQSLFSSPGGDRFYELYLAFSSHVLRKACLAKNPSAHIIRRPSLSQHGFAEVSQDMKQEIVIGTLAFKETQAMQLEHYQLWRKCTDDFIACYRNIKASLKSKNALLEEKANTLTSLYSDAACSDSQEAYAFSKYFEDLKQVRLLWSKISEFLEQEKELWKIVGPELNRKTVYTLDGSDYKISVPKLLLENCQTDIEAMDLKNLESNGKLSLIKFTKLWLLCLDYYIKEFKRVGLPDHNQLEAHALSMSSITEYLEFTKSLSKRLLHDIIPDMVENIESLRAKLLNDDISESDEELCSKFPSLLAKRSFSPESVKRRCFPSGSSQLVPFAEDDYSLNETPKPVNGHSSSSDSSGCYFARDSITTIIEAPRNTMMSVFSPIRKGAILHSDSVATNNTVSDEFKSSFMNDTTNDDVFSSSRFTFEGKIEEDQKREFSMRQSWLDEPLLDTLDLTPVPIYD